MTDTVPVAERIAALEARAAIEHSVANYAHGLDKRDAELFLSAWDEAATWGARPGLVLSGHDEILRYAVGGWDAFRQTNHWCTNLTVEIDGDVARGLLDVVSVSEALDGSWWRSANVYHDSYRRHGRRWLIADRTIENRFRHHGDHP